MYEHRLNRRHFFFGTLLAGAVPTAGFGSAASLKHMGYKSPNEKMNLAAIVKNRNGFRYGIAFVDLSREEETEIARVTGILALTQT